MPPRRVALVLLALPATAVARDVVYDLDEAGWAALAAREHVAPAALPAAGAHRLALTVAQPDPAVHRGGLMCAAWRLTNPVAPMLTQAMSHRDRTGALAAPGEADIAVSVTAAATDMRCARSGACTTRVTLDATVTPRGGAARAVHTEKEQATRIAGFCGGLSGAVALATRAAAIALVDAADPADQPGTRSTADAGSGTSIQPVR